MTYGSLLGFMVVQGGSNGVQLSSMSSMSVQLGSMSVQGSSIFEGDGSHRCCNESRSWQQIPGHRRVWRFHSSTAEFS